MKTQLLLAAAALALAGCTDPEGHPLWLVLSVDKTTVAVDDSIRVSIVVTNVSDSDVMTPPEDEYDTCLPGFEVTDGEGRPVQMNVVCPLVAVPLEPLPPGVSLNITTWWYPGISRVDGVAIGQGEYSIRAAISGDGRIARSGAFDLVVTE